MFSVKTYSFLLLMLFVVKTNSQSQLNAWTDRSFYGSGENIRIGINCQGCVDREIIHLELKNRKGEIVSNSMVRNTSMQTGSLPIPLNSSSDYYEAIAYTLWSPDASVKDYISIIVPIFNAFSDPDINTESLSSKPQIKSNSIPTLDCRAEVSIELNLTKLNLPDVNEIDICIYPDAYEFESQSPVGLSFKKPSDQAAVLLNPVYFGKISQNELNTLTAMYTSNLAQFDWLYIDQGVFSVSLKDLPIGSEVSFVSLSPEGKLNYFKPELFSPSTTFNLKPSFPTVLEVDARIKSYLNDLRKRWVINELYPPSISETETYSVVELPESDRVYVPKDYIQFTDTKEFITEVVALIKLKELDGKFSFSILLDNKAYSFHEPLMFLNGGLIDDPQLLLNLSLSNINRIEIYRKNETLRKHFSALGRNGAVAFYTNNSSALVPKDRSQTTIQGFQLSSKPIKHDVMLDDSRPVVSPLIYCDQILRQGKASLKLSFQTTDDQGNYTIRLTGFTADGTKVVEKFPIIIANKKS